MQTPGILVMAGNGREPLNRLSEYAKTAEQIGLRSFLVTETPATDALAVTQHIASITSRIQVGTRHREHLYTSSLATCGSRDCNRRAGTRTLAARIGYQPQAG
jgi:luciferase-like monooxygenase